MLSRPCTAALLAVCALPLAAQHTAAVEAGWHRFQREHPGLWTRIDCAATGTPQAIFGPGYALDGFGEATLAAARAHAGRVLDRHRDLLGLGDCEWRERIGARMGRTFVFVYDQFVGGLPVVGGRADVRIHDCGRVVLLGSRAVPIPPGFAVVPALDAEQAQARAWLALGAEPQPAPAPTLCIYADVDAPQPAVPRLCWQVPVRSLAADGDGRIGRYFVDAQDGRVLHYANDKHACGLAAEPAGESMPRTRPASAVAELASGSAAFGSGPAVPPPPATYTVMGFVRSGLGATDPLVNRPLPGLEIAVPGVGTVITDGNGQFTASLNTPVQITVALDGVHCRPVTGSSAPTASATLQPGVGSTIQLLSANATDAQVAHTCCYEWIHRTAEFARSVLGDTPELRAADQLQPRVNVAQTCNAYYANDAIDFYSAGGSCHNAAFATAVAHEWGHCLDDHYGGISQTEGLSEGFSDVVAMYLVDDPIVGRGFYVNGGFLRTGDNTRQYPPPAEVHAAGEVFMGFAWKLRQQLRQRLGTAAALPISNTIVLGSIVANAQDQAAAVREVFLAADDDGNLLNGVPHYNELELACRAHNLPYPQRQVGDLQHAPLGTTDQQLSPRLVRVTAVPQNGSFTALRLCFDAGAGPQQRPLVPTGNTDEYAALLPGLLAPTPLRYHLEADHSSGARLRLPLSGEFTADVVGDGRVFFDDFEQAGAGWTHGFVAGEDDWQIGAPAGRSGSGWSDPPQAFGGSACAGNDLTNDGAYGPGVDNWLRSPPIDCTGRSGLRLRFQRWLTVDAALRDQAFVVVNGTAYAWLNPALSPTLDGAWTACELPIPAADGSPNASVEFHLRSDGSGSFGGWTLDDVEVVAGNVATPPAVQLQLVPEQATGGSPMLLTVRTPGPQPFVLVLGDTPGPLPLPGGPTLQVGGTLATLVGWTDASGAFSLPLSAPANVGATAAVFYSQVLTLDAQGRLQASNANLTLLSR